MRIPYMKPGYVMGPTTGNMLIAVCNAFLNMSVVPGTKNDVLISELNSILSLDVANLGGTNTTTSNPYYRGNWDISAGVPSLSDWQVGDTVSRDYEDAGGTIYRYLFMLTGAPDADGTVPYGPKEDTPYYRLNNIASIDDNYWDVAAGHWPTGYDVTSLTLKY